MQKDATKKEVKKVAVMVTANSRAINTLNEATADNTAAVREMQEWRRAVEAGRLSGERADRAREGDAERRTGVLLESRATHLRALGAARFRRERCAWSTCRRGTVS